jgi:hypothetical protein
MPGGGTRPGEEVRDGPHNNNSCGGNRGGVAPTAASLKPRVGLGLTGSGLIMRLLVAASFSALLFSTRPSLCLLEALRGTSGAANMITPGGARTPLRDCHIPPVRGVPASLIGSELFSPIRLWPFALPRPDALSPLPATLSCAVSCVCGHRTHNTQRHEHPLAGVSWPIGVGRCPLSRRSPPYANYALSEFLEGRIVLLVRVC